MPAPRRGPAVARQPGESRTMTENIKISWYRCRVDKAVMSGLMRKSDARGFAQAVPQLLLYAATGTLAYLAFRGTHSGDRHWMLPLLLLALFVHGTLGSFFGGVACHELCHKTPFASPFWNGFFLRIYAFLAWFDPVGYRASHIRHHQVTVYAEHDGEVVLPTGLDWHGIRFITASLTFSPRTVARNLRFWVSAACGRLTRDGFFKAKWLQRVVPESNREQRRELVLWARVVLLGHLALAALFVATGHWFLIVVVTFGCQYCSWLALACGAPQHVGMSPNVPDFRLNTRTYTCGWLPAFLYWNMQYHVEHHMFPAVPFYNLPRLRSAIERDLPPATHGLLATWRELLPIMRRQREDPAYVFVPELPGGQGDRAGDDLIRAEASQ
jgi:fatty acid desaturase